MKDRHKTRSCFSGETTRRARIWFSQDPGARVGNHSPSVRLHYNSDIGGRTTRHPGYRVDRVTGERIKETSGPINIIGKMAKAKFQGQSGWGQMSQFKTASYNLLPGRHEGLARHQNETLMTDGLKIM